MLGAMARIELFRSDESVSFDPGKTIFSEGEPGDFMYVVVDGEVDIVANGRVIETACAGGLVGELALIDRSPRSATAVARTPAKLVPVDAKQFQYLIQQTPFFALQVMAIMAERLRRWRP
jgi:CRP-like cAMP-binding protein